MVTRLAHICLWLGRESELSCQPGEVNCPDAYSESQSPGSRCICRADAFNSSVHSVFVTPRGCAV